MRTTVMDLVPYSTLNASSIAEAARFLAHSHADELEAEGFHQFRRRNEHIRDALVSAVHAKNRYEFGIYTNYMLLSTQAEVTDGNKNLRGFASVLPGLVVLEPVHPFLGRFPLSFLKIAGRLPGVQSQKPVLDGNVDKSANIALFVTDQTTVDVADGAEVVEKLVEAAHTRHGVSVAWTLLQLDSPKAAWFVENGFTHEAQGRFDEREGQLGELPVRDLYVRAI